MNKKKKERTTKWKESGVKPIKRWKASSLEILRDMARECMERKRWVKYHPRKNDERNVSNTAVARHSHFVTWHGLYGWQVIILSCVVLATQHIKKKESNLKVELKHKAYNKEALIFSLLVLLVCIIFSADGCWWGVKLNDLESSSTESIVVAQPSCQSCFSTSSIQPLSTTLNRMMPWYLSGKREWRQRECEMQSSYSD